MASLAIRHRGLAARLLLAAAVAAGLSQVACGATGLDSYFASRVVDYSPGVGYELFPDPTLALGGPRGGGAGVGSLDVVTLGVSGELVLGFAAGLGVCDARGPDLIVFENAFNFGMGRFAELVWVGVSTNGVDYAFFPSICRVAGPVPAYGSIDPADVEGFAGVTPVFADVGAPGEPGNALDPFDPAEAGGDAFDLADLAGDRLVASGAVDLSRIYYVRLLDVLGDGSQLDSEGNPIYDPTGNMDPPYSDETSADIDALAVIHGLAAPLPGDANRSGKVDVGDLALLAGHWQMPAGATWEDADFNADGAVNVGDLAILAGNWAPGGGSGQSVPEPSGLLVLTVGAGVVWVRRRAKTAR